MEYTATWRVKRNMRYYITSHYLEAACCADAASAALQSLHQRPEQHPECVGDPVQDGETEEAPGQHNPGPRRLRGGVRRGGDEGGSPGGGGANL